MSTATMDFADTTKKLGDQIMGLTLKEAKELSDYLKDIHGSEPAAGGAVMMAGPAGGGAAAEAAVEQTEFTVQLDGFGDKKIGGVVNSAEVVNEKSTIDDTDFETCMRESMYGVYFEPPPANVRATLNFDVTMFEDGGLDEEVEDFHPRDRRNE